MTHQFPAFLSSHGKLLSLDHPVIMGIINATPDSFYTKDIPNTCDDIFERIHSMINEGAQIIDIGGMSTRPNSSPVSIQEETDRILPVLEWTRKHFPDIFISIDTYRSGTVQQCLAYQIDIVNDISAAQIDPNILSVSGQNNLIYIASHIQGRPSNMQDNPSYKDVLNEVADHFLKFISELKKHQVHQFILDPGFGFGKTTEHNYQLLNIYKKLQFLNIPMMAGISRKSMIWKVLDTTPHDSLYGSVAAHTIALLNGADILRVHDVKAAGDCIKIVQTFREYS